MLLLKSGAKVHFCYLWASLITSTVSEPAIASCILVQNQTLEIEKKDDN
jgi:hypothetical protein